MSESGLQNFDDTQALSPGTRFGELEILRTIGVGGFGIVYLALDHALERQVAVKEYMPAQLAQRSREALVSVRSTQHAETFELGLRSFVNEARLLARFDHPSLLKVYRFWEANGTAYMAMPFLQGQTLKQVRDAFGAAPSEAWILKRVLPMIEALRLLHAERVYHRDVAPDNIFLPADGSDPILLDFGAARRAIGDRTQSFTAIFKPSYAPIEQYGETTSLRQGPWTDVYALGAVLHYLMLGAPPPLATTRAVADEFVPLAQRDLAGFSPHFCAAVDWALSVRPAQRPQTVEELREALTGQRTLPAVRGPSEPTEITTQALADPAPRTQAASPPPGAPRTQPPADATVLLSPATPTEARAAAVANREAFAATQVVAAEPPDRAPTPAEEATRVVPRRLAAAPPNEETATLPRPQPVIEALADPATRMDAAPIVPPARALKPWLLGGGAAAVLMLAMFWWLLQQRQAPAGQSAAASAPATTLPAPASVAAPAIVAPTLASQAASVPVAPPESRVATVNLGVPASVPTQPALTRPLNPNPAAEGRSAAQPGADGRPAPARRPINEGRPPQRELPTAARVEPPLPPQPAASVAVAPSQEASRQAAPQGPASPTEACGKRVLFALWRCVERKCEEEPRFHDHPECRSLRERRERLQQN